MKIRIENTSPGEPEATVVERKLEDLPAWVAHEFESEASTITVARADGSRTVYTVAEA